MTEQTISTFTAMDHSTQEQWSHIATETVANQPRVAETVLAMLKNLEAIVDGFAVNQLVHSLQTATRAEEAGADEEVIVASLCHDLGKGISVANHPKIAAEILRPYVRPEVSTMIAVHQDFQGKHYYEFLGMDPNLRQNHLGKEYYELAEQFADDWDQTSFDPNYPTQSLEHFEPMVRRVFAQPRSL
ncbi:MAG: HD domain-containing protein [Actinomycetes bacterium]